jgi:hypothetical protein
MRINPGTWGVAFLLDWTLRGQLYRQERGKRRGNVVVRSRTKMSINLERVALLLDLT